MFKRTLLAACAFILLAVPLVIAEPLPSGKDLNKIASGIYVLDKSHASMVFKINHLGFSMYHGRFNVLDAKINFDAKVPEKSIIEVTVDTKSIDTNNAKLHTELMGEKWFNTAQFPTATFKSLHTTRTGDGGTMIGELTMLGVTKPITLNVVFHGAGQNPFSKLDTLGFSATGIISRSQWGMSNYVPMVGDDVNIEIEAEFQKASEVSAQTEPVKVEPAKEQLIKAEEPKKEPVPVAATEKTPEPAKAEEPAKKK